MLSLMGLVVLFIAAGAVSLSAILPKVTIEILGVAVVVWCGLTLLTLLFGLPAILLICFLFVVIAGLCRVGKLRRSLLSDPLYQLIGKNLPTISPTEQQVLDAGDVWWEGELFSGKPQWKKLLSMPQAELTADEKQFIEEKVPELCRQLDEWSISKHDKQLPEQILQQLKRDKYLLWYPRTKATLLESTSLW